MNSSMHSGRVFHMHSRPIFLISARMGSSWFAAIALLTRCLVVAIASH